MTHSRGGHTAENVGGKIYVFGGQDPADATTHCMEVYDPAVDLWEQLSEPTNFAFSTSITY